LLIWKLKCCSMSSVFFSWSTVSLAYWSADSLASCSLLIKSYFSFQNNRYFNFSFSFSLYFIEFVLMKLSIEAIFTNIEWFTFVASKVFLRWKYFRTAYITVNFYFRLKLRFLLICGFKRRFWSGEIEYLLKSLGIGSLVFYGISHINLRRPDNLRSLTNRLFHSKCWHFLNLYLGTLLLRLLLLLIVFGGLGLLNLAWLWWQK